MLVVIDGTGESNQALYKSSMTGSFINKLHDSSKLYPKKYFRGPTNLGMDCSTIVKDALNWISMNLANSSVNEELYLAGYSRGGAIAIAIAQEIKKLAGNPSEQLQYDRGTYMIDPDHAVDFQKKLSHDFEIHWRKLNANIRCMALFDAVDRAITLDTDLIPSNVQKVYHAVRNPNISRPTFANTGLRHEDPHKLIIRTPKFRCTHAAMGGIPWTGDHPVEWVKYGKVLRTIDTLNPFGGAATSPLTRDAVSLAFGVETPEISGFTKLLITEQQDRTESDNVKAWMWYNMSQYGMV